MAELERLKLLQPVITRMAGNSFLLKGWAVSLVTGLAALAKVGDGNEDVAWISCGVLALFAVLDAYYLALERVFRDMYEDEAANPTSTGNYSLKPPPRTPGVRGVLRALVRFPVLPFYLAALIGSILVATDKI